jgi:predicted PurR-regulated permease PerM
MATASGRAGANAADVAFGRKVLIVALAGMVLATLWILADVLLLFFGSTLLAILLGIIARPLLDLGTPRWVAISIVSAAVLCALVGLAWILGAQIGEELQNLSARLGEASRWLAGMPFAQAIGNMDTDVPAALIPRFASWTVSAGAAVVGLVLVLAGAVYLAIGSRTYLDGFLKLIPEPYLPSVSATIDDAHHALERWLGGQLIIMVVVGTMTGVGLWLIGLDSALALGLLAGAANFVPYLGSIAAAAVTLIVAASHNWEMVLWAGGILFAIQQLESNVLQPIVGGGSVSLPPAIALYAIAAMGLLFGPLGLLFGFPLAVVSDIAIRRIYVRDTLDRPVEILGNDAEKSEAQAN